MNLTSFDRYVGIGFLRGMMSSVCFGILTVSVAMTASQASARGLPDFTELVEQVGPSVVNIRTIEKTSSRSRLGELGGDSDEDMQELLRRFFGERGLPQPKADPKDPKADPRAPKNGKPQAEPKQERQRGVGSGFVLSSDGFVMTNAHVVEGADEVLVTLTDKREFKAKIIGADKRSDVAVIKIDASGLSAVKIGDVSKLKVGEWVMAIGSPFGLENTVTAGIVSAKQRDTGELLPLIQTDVAINPGNSGGPLINMRGEVVGINSQIYSRSGGFQGISFAIPMDEAIRVSNQLRSSGRVARGRIGVQIETVNKDVADAMGLAKTQGALVRGVEAGGPAALAGVEAGDVILKFGGVTIEKSSDLPRIVGNTKPGSKSTITVFRRGNTKEFPISLIDFEDEKVAKAPSSSKTEKPKSGTGAQALGLVISDLSDSQKKEMKMKSGVVVESATEQAARAGLRENDVIVSIAGNEISNVKEFETVLSKTDKSKSISIMYKRGDWMQFTLIKPAK